MLRILQGAAVATPCFVTYDSDIMNFITIIDIT